MVSTFYTVNPDVQELKVSNCKSNPQGHSTYWYCR